MPKVFEEVNGMPLVRAAQSYAAYGWPVFPVMPKRKEPLIPTGFKGATSDLDQIAAWWRKWPDANIGAPTGAAMGNWVLDVDVSDGKPGLESLATLVARYGSLDTLEVRTGSGGRHLYLGLPEGGAPSRVALLPGLDARGEGGYVVLPPSVHATGQKYLWSGLDREILATPEWLIELLRRPSTRADPASGRAGAVEGWGSIGWWHGGPIEKGARNQTLYSIACSAVARGYDQEAILGLVSKINHRHSTEPVGMDEVEKLVKSACTQAPTYSRTDVGNAEALKAFAAGKFVWVPELKSNGWHEYDGVRWSPTSEKAVWRQFHSLLAYWREVARRLGDEGASLKAWANSSAWDGRIRAATSQFSSLVDRPIGLFNEGLDLLPLADGKTIFLGTDGKWEPRSSRLEDYSLNALPVKYNQSATCPTWDRAMRVWTEGRKDLEEFLWRWMGCLLTGRLLHHKMLVIVGPTKGGKTTLSEALNLLLGGFSEGMSVDLLTNEKNFNKDAEKARLFGKRLAYFSEATSTSEFHPGTIKNLTGEDVIRARPLYATAFNFQMTAKLLLHTNEVPTAKQVDPAMENRLMFLEWCSTIPPEERDPKLREKLVAEGPGWLNRCLEAYEAVCQELGKQDGTEEKALKMPKSVLDAVAQYRDDMDMVQRWIEECCAVGVNERVRRSDVWRSWTDWCKENRIGRGKQQVFWSQLRGKGLEEVASMGNVYIKGLSLQEREIVVD